MHVHVATTEGEAKFWLEPEVTVAKNHGMNEQLLNRARKLIEDHEQEIRDAWNKHFPG